MSYITANLILPDDSTVAEWYSEEVFKTMRSAIGSSKYPTVVMHSTPSQNGNVIGVIRDRHTDRIRMTIKIENSDLDTNDEYYAIIGLYIDGSKPEGMLLTYVEMIDKSNVDTNTMYFSNDAMRDAYNIIVNKTPEGFVLYTHTKIRKFKPDQEENRVNAFTDIKVDAEELKSDNVNTGEITDGYHTFNELYDQRAKMLSVICNVYKDRAWKSLKHADGSMYENMFIFGIDTPAGMATYHMDIDPYWDMFHCEELAVAPEWDKHTPEQAAMRLLTLSYAKPCIESV